MSSRTRNIALGLSVALAIAGVISVVVLLSSGPSETNYAGQSFGGDGEQLDRDYDEGDTVEIDGETYVIGEDGWAYREDGEVHCASVLSGPLNEPGERSERREQRENEDLPEDVHIEDDLLYSDVSEDAWVVADCNRLRQQRLGQAVLIGLPTLMLFTLSVVLGARRPED